MNPPAATKTDAIVLGGGCFWCLDAAYKLLPGVIRVTCGYAGGTVANPTYEQVCAETTGHAEVVKVEFDPAKVEGDRVLAYFWAIHDPTQVGGQGNDLGSQYRSIILYSDPAQQRAAEQSRAAAQEGLVEADHHRDRAAGKVLAGGGLSSGLLREASGPRLLCGGDPSEGGQAQALAWRGPLAGGQDSGCDRNLRPPFFVYPENCRPTAARLATPTSHASTPSIVSSAVPDGGPALRHGNVGRGGPRRRNPRLQV